MRISTLMKKLLNVKGIVVKDVYFDRDRKGECLVVNGRPSAKHAGRCGVCGRRSPRYDTPSPGRRWRALDFGHMRVYVESDVYRVDCREHGVSAMRVPWARHDALFTYDFEQTVAWLARHASKTVVSNLMRIAWNTVGPIVKRVVKDVEDNAPNRFDGLVRIGIDETSYKKGHKYMTTVTDHDTGKLIWAAPGFGKKTLASFFNALSEEQRASILYVSADAARWIAECVKEYCPNANRCVDPFHVVQWTTEARGAVRKKAWRTAREDLSGAGGEKRKRGRPKKGKEKQKDAASSIKGFRYALLKNPENLSAGQAAAIEVIAKSNPKLYRAYLMKEALRAVFRLPIEAAREAIAAWIKWAQHCRIPEFVELQRKIRRHLEGILASIEHGVSNGRVEAINNKIKLTVRIGYGFRNLDNLIGLVMLRCANIAVDLPGRM